MALPPLLELVALTLRGLQFLFAIIELGITGHVASYLWSPSQNSFLVFVSAWTILILLFLVVAPRFAPQVAHPLALAALDGLTMLFWFAGFIALAVFDHRLHESYYEDIFYVYKACDGTGNLCGEVTAAVVFGAFEWALFLATTVLSAVAAMKGRGGSSGTTHTPATV